MLWTARPGRARVAPRPQFSKHFDQLAVDTLKCGRMFGHGQRIELFQPPQGLVDPGLAGNDGRRRVLGSGLFFHA
jgi:hypothetical protein